MSTTRNIAIVATLATLIAGPAFALDEDTAATTVNSGRYIGQQVSNVKVPAGAYASVYGPQRREDSHIWQPTVEQHDFQLEGRGL